MTIAFSCECGQQMQAKEEHAGRPTRCPKCGRDMTIPGIEKAPPPPEPLRPEGVTGRPRRDVGYPDDEDDERRERRRPQSSGMGAGWIVLLVVGIVMAVILLCIVPIILIGLLLPAVQKVREAAGRTQSSNNLKVISIGLMSYSDTYQRLPPAVVYDQDGKPLYSWRVLILPYIEEEALYKEFHLDEPWDSPHNKPLLARMPKTYAPPGEWPAKEPYATYYQVFDGPGAAFDSDKSKGLQPFTLVPPGPSGRQVMASTNVVKPVDIRDGTSNTFLVVEAGEPVPWSKPADLPWDPNKPLPKLGGLPFGNAFNAAFADGSVRSIPRNTNEATLRACITIAGGENVLPP